MLQRYECIILRTDPPEPMHRCNESFRSGQQHMFEVWVTLGLAHLYTGTVFVWGEPGAFWEQAQLGRGSCEVC